MAKFAIYNYQFEPMLERFEQMQLDFPEWEKVDPKVSFENRQQIFGQLFEDDYNQVKGRTLDFELRKRPYRHDHLMKPTDGIIVMRVANKRTTRITKADFSTSDVDDYPNCLVIFDNRPGIQRLLIEQKSSVFTETKTVANIMSQAFNKILAYYKLSVSLDPIFRTKEFENTVNQFTEGFRKIIIHLPHKNLDRVMEEMETSLTDVRADWETAMDISFIAPKGGRVPIDLKNERQMGLVRLGSTIGGATIEMIPTGRNRSSVWCGEGHFVTEGISDTIFKGLTEKNPMESLFEEDSPLNQLKLAMKAIKNHYD